jgi:mono/diheme cytochrome c family protein
VAKWESLADPLLLVQQMWNHGTAMRAAFAARKLAWARLTSQQLTDVLAYLQDLPETRAVTRAFPLPPAGTGEQLFQSKGCANCHTGVKAPENLMKNDSRAATSMWKRSRSSALQDRLMNQTVTDSAADMWNHLPKMKQPPPALAPEETREIVAYIWTRQYFTGRGNAVNGKKIFSEKHCAACHEDPSSGAPKLGKHKDGYSDVTIVAAMWKHGPRLVEWMKQKKLPWPQFREQQLSDLIAYLNSL